MTPAVTLILQDEQVLIYKQLLLLLGHTSVHIFALSLPSHEISSPVAFKLKSHSSKPVSNATSCLMKSQNTLPPPHLECQHFVLASICLIVLQSGRYPVFLACWSPEGKDHMATSYPFPCVLQYKAEALVHDRHLNS